MLVVGISLDESVKYIVEVGALRLDVMITVLEIDEVLLE